VVFFDGLGDLGVVSIWLFIDPKCVGHVRVFLTDASCSIQLLGCLRLVVRP